MPITNKAQRSSLTPAEVARAWAQGWVLSRDTPAAIDHGTHLTIPVGLPGHRIRHVLPTFSADVVEALTQGQAVNGTWLKVLASQETVRPLLPKNWGIHEREYLMQTTLASTHPDSEAPKVSFERNGGVITATLLGPNGDAAARARAAVVGPAGVFDQVVTKPLHRRKGYGSILMRRLASECRQEGATVGILVATEEGRLLYSALGWEVASEVTAVSYLEE